MVTEAIIVKKTSEAPVEDASAPTEFPVPVAQFIKTLTRTPDEVWSRLIFVGHRTENHTLSEWHKILGDAKNGKVN